MGTEMRVFGGILVPERRVLTHFDAEMRVRKGDNGKRTIEGYAAKFNALSQDLGGFQEKLHEKTFDRCLKRCDVRGLRNHDPDKLLGRTKSGTMRLATDDIGLRYEIDVPETQVGRDTVTDIERGDLDGSSFSFTVDEGDDDWDMTTTPPTRTVRNVRDLFDVGPVTYPAYLDTTTAARSLERRQLELRAVILPHPSQVAANLRRVRLLKLRCGLPIFERDSNG